MGHYIVLSDKSAGYRRHEDALREDACSIETLKRIYEQKTGKEILTETHIISLFQRSIYLTNRLQGKN